MRCGVRENVLEPMIRAQPVSKPEPLDCDLHNGFSASLPPSGETGRLEEPGVGYLPSPPGLLGSDKTPAGEALVK